MRKWCTAAFFLLACGGGLERASYATDALSYAPGGRVQLSLGNVCDRELGANLCISQLVTEAGEPTGLSDDELCDVAMQPLLPGERLVHRKTMPVDTPPGRYRYEATIVLPNGLGERIFTEVFTVE